MNNNFTTACKNSEIAWGTNIPPGLSLRTTDIDFKEIFSNKGIHGSDEDSNKGKILTALTANAHIHTYV